MVTSLGKSAVSALTCGLRTSTPVGAKACDLRDTGWSRLQPRHLLVRENKALEMMRLHLSICRVTWNAPAHILSADAHKFFEKTIKKKADTPNWVFENVSFDNNLWFKLVQMPKKRHILKVITFLNLSWISINR